MSQPRNLTWRSRNNQSREERGRGRGAQNRFGKRALYNDAIQGLLAAVSTCPEPHLVTCAGT
eukprot:1859614-Rhodomonas_salina.2